MWRDALGGIWSSTPRSVTQTADADGPHVVTFVSQYPYPDQFEADADYFCGGGERVARRLAEGFADRDWQVSVFTAAAGREYERAVQNGVTVARSPSLARVNNTQLAPTLPVDALPARADVVHAHNTTPPGVLAAWAFAAARGVPLVITHHGGENYERHGSVARRVGLAAYTRLLIRLPFERAAAVVTPSAGYVAESSVLSLATDVRTIPNGVEADAYELDVSRAEAKRLLDVDPDSFTVLYLGAHHPRKGVDVLLSAFDRFSARRCDDPTLILAGSGDSTDGLLTETRRRGLVDSVRFPGFVPEAEKPLYMTAADVFVLPSVTPSAEVFPLVLLEAAAAGTPVVASDFPTLRSVIEPTEAGVLVESGNADAIADALGRLRDDETRLETMCANARELARDHDWDGIVDRYETLFDEVAR